VEGGRFFLTDMGSANGSRVNGVSVTDTELFHDDVILIGESTLLFVTPPSETEPVPEMGISQPEQAREGGETAEVAFLTVRSPRQRPQLHAVTLSTAQIGRARDNEIRVVDWFVEPCQARILRDPEGFRLVNLAPRTPIFCNQEVVEDVLLQDGDVIQMGMSQIAFALQDETAPEIETVKNAPQPEAPAGGATEYMAYVPSDESFEPMTPLDETEAADLDNAIDQVIGESPVAPASQHEMQWDTTAQPDHRPQHEPWDRWAEELSTELPAETVSETPSDTNEAESEEIVQETASPEKPFDELSPLPQPSPEEQAFTDLEEILETQEETSTSEYASEPVNAFPQDSDIEFRTGAFEPEEMASTDEMQDETDASETQEEATFEEPLLQPQAFTSGAVAWVEDPLQEKPASPSVEETAAQENLEETPDQTGPAEPSVAAEESPAEATLSAGVDPAKVAFWEKALNNPSPAVVKQALEQLKRLTGRDYDR
ncbi:MAG TPA: FHA domain-containing protein, partial [Candidatus Sumerlaeota bacterium]|nr:FHA domain-containing protein [Candidatus Sumerlaeota bacterium]